MLDQASLAINEGGHEFLQLCATRKLVRSCSVCFCYFHFLFSTLPEMNRSNLQFLLLPGTGVETQEPRMVAGVLLKNE